MAFVMREIKIAAKIPIKIFIASTLFDYSEQTILFPEKRFLFQKLRVTIPNIFRIDNSLLPFCRFCLLRYYLNGRLAEMSANFSSIYSEFNVNLLKNGENPSYVFEDYRLDAASLMLYRGEKEIVLPPKAIETLLILVENQGTIVSKEDLIERLWADTAVEESNLTHYLYVLRKTLGKTVDGKLFIETFRRRGYRFNSEARRLESFTPDSRQESHAAPKISAAPPHHEVERRGNV